MKTYTKLPCLIVCAIGLVILFVPLHTFGQGPGMPGDPGYDPDKEVPIDGGIALLMVAGLAYGFKKINDTRQDSTEG